jgi:hypothetical protein
VLKEFAWVIMVSGVGSCRIAAQSAAALPGRITGQVSCSDSRTPCRFASVTIQSVASAAEGGAKPGKGGGSYSAATDLNGTYVLSGVAPGDYYVLGRLAGYLSPYDLLSAESDKDAVLPAKALEAALPKVHVEANQTARMDLALSRGASLGGVVRYDDGGVAIGMGVHLWRKDPHGEWKPYTDGSGNQPLAAVGFTMYTNDRGQYSAPGMPPGTYVVEVGLPEVSITPTTITGRQSIQVLSTSGGALRVFSGDTYRLSQAASFELHEGESLSDVDITIPTVGLCSVQGAVSAKANGDGLGEAKVRLLDPGSKQTLRETATLGDGTFSFQNVVPGNYLVQVEAHGTRDQGGTGYRPLTAPLEVAGDAAGLAYALAAQ